jgi:hypothetical protein
MRARVVAVAVALCGASVALSFAPRAVRAQVSAGVLVSRALEAETAGRHGEAVIAWRAAIAGGAVLPGVLGLERVFAMLGTEADLLVPLDSLIPLFPAEAGLRSAQLRTLVTVGRDDDAAAAFRAWRDARPEDVVPYREFARVLLFNDRAASADTVIREAIQALGATRALLLEQAQLRAALGGWREAADAWRETMRDQAYFEQAAIFSLGPAPAEARDSVRAALRAPTAPLAATQVLAVLEIGWGAPRAGWQTLSALPPSDTVIGVWRAFAEEAERAQAWATLRDALAAIHRAKPDAPTAIRAAQVALRAHDPEGALALVRASGAPSADEEVAGLELEALARLGRGAEASAVLDRAAPLLGERATRSLKRTVAWAWVRAGEVERAREALREAPIDAEDAVSGWLALYDGDLVTARTGLRRAEAFGADAVGALALLSRTEAERSPMLGAAYLALARGDSARAASAFADAIGELVDAASLLLAVSARLDGARGADSLAIPRWERIVAEFAQSPEAPEALLEMGRAAARRGDRGLAQRRFEALILQYPESALVPQARRALDVVTGATRGVQ